MTVGSPPSRTAMHELVVPRSIPIVFALRGSELGLPGRALGYPFRVEPLVDSWGRSIGSLRVSVTDKCNFRCTYCMPAEGLEWLPKREVLSFEEIERLVRGPARIGVREGRAAGGEPPVRRDPPQ